MSPVLKAAGVIGLATGASRILGFARDCLIAAAYGTSLTAQAFVVAFRIPNTLRDLVGEGAANTAFVPVMSRVRAQEGSASWEKLAQALWIRMLALFLLLSLAGVAAAPLLVRLIAPGFAGESELLSKTILLTQILFPFVGLVGLSAFFMGALNSAHRFLSSSLGPALLNVSMIAGIFLWRPDALGLASGVIAGGLLQLLIQWPSLSSAGLRFTLRRESHPAVREVATLLVPRIIGTGVYQAGVLVDTIFASFGNLVGAGGVASLYFAHRFLHLPLALFGISMAQAALPTLSAHAALGDRSQARKTLLLALRSSLFIAIPSSVGLIVLGHPIIQVLLERGAFSSEATATTAAALQWYALGLAGFCAVKVLANTLYAYADTWTPVRSAGQALALNVLFNLLLVKPMGLSGLALATSLSSLWNCLHLYGAVKRRVGSLGGEIKPWFLRVLAASLGMAAVSRLFWSLTCGTISLKAWSAIPLLMFTVSVGVASFFLLALLLGVEEARGLVQWARKRSP